MVLPILLLLSLDKDIHGKPKKLNSKQLDSIRKLGYVNVLTNLGCHFLFGFLAFALNLVVQFCVFYLFVLFLFSNLLYNFFFF